MIESYSKLKVSYFLPSNFNRGDNYLFLSVIKTYEDIIKLYYDFWSNLDNFTPELIDETLIDWLATETANPWRTLWDFDWQIDAKRLLLRDTTKIFSKRLFPETLTVLFQDFSLNAYLRPKSGFILGTVNPPASLLPATLGTSILDYEIVIPESYYQGSIEYNLVVFIADNFGTPGRVPIVFGT
jgi:hypothetical protein